MDLHWDRGGWGRGRGLRGTCVKCYRGSYKEFLRGRHPSYIKLYMISPKEKIVGRTSGGEYTCAPWRRKARLMKGFKPGEVSLAADRGKNHGFSGGSSRGMVGGRAQFDLSGLGESNTVSRKTRKRKKELVERGGASGQPSPMKDHVTSRSTIKKRSIQYLNWGGAKTSNNINARKHRGWR